MAPDLHVRKSEAISLGRADSVLVQDIPDRCGPYPRILDTGCDYAAVASVAARRAS